MRIANAKAEDWSQPSLAPVVPLRRPKRRSVALLIEAAILGGLFLLGIAVTHAAAHVLAGRPMGQDACCSAPAAPK